ncbi:hypothetical protein NXS19_012269 [Fusarium pseudograminearum]|nr:hypothetical protein NXS19_012269 [Fusarium pseudograminearum]
MAGRDRRVPPPIVRKYRALVISCVRNSSAPWVTKLAGFWHHAARPANLLSLSQDPRSSNLLNTILILIDIGLWTLYPDGTHSFFYIDIDSVSPVIQRKLIVPSSLWLLIG